MSDDSREITILGRGVRRWQVIVSAGSLGAVTLLFVGSFLTVEYEASTVLSVSVDYGIAEVGLGSEDRLLTQIQQLLLSDQTLERLLDEIPQSIRSERQLAAPKDLLEFLTLERRLTHWHLIAIDSDPSIAAEIADAWGEVALEAMREGAEHAWRAVTLLEGSVRLACSHTPDLPLLKCDAEAFRGGAEMLSSEVRAEEILSNGMLPMVSFELQQASPDFGVPRTNNRGALALIGATLGSLVGAALVWARGRRSLDEH